MKELQKDNSKTKEQELTLKYVRKIFKTNNGFSSFLIDQKGEEIPITQNCYLKLKKLGVGKNKN